MSGGTIGSRVLSDDARACGSRAASSFRFLFILIRFGISQPVNRWRGLTAIPLIGDNYAGQSSYSGGET